MKCSLHKIFFSFLFLQFAFCNFLFAQPITFEKYYDFGWSETGNYIIPTYDDGYIIAGVQAISFGNVKAIALKIDSLGNQEWITYVSSSANDRIGNAIVQCADSGYTMTGSADGNIYLLKLNKNGDTLWSKFYNGLGSETAYDIKQTYDGGYIFTGNTGTGMSGEAKAFTIKTNSSGDTLWTRMRGGNESAGSRTVVQTQDSGFAVLGTTSNPGTSYPSQSFYLIKYDKNGNFLWEKYFNADSSKQNQGYSIQELENGDLIMAGSVYYNSEIRWDVYLIRTDSEGNKIWDKSYGTNREEGLYSACINPADSSILLTGLYSNPNYSPGYDILLMKVNLTGDSLWSRLYGGSNDETTHRIICDKNGGSVIVGATSSYGAVIQNIYLLKTDEIGCIAPGCDTIPFPYTEVNFNREISSLILFPNPVHSDFTIQFTALNDAKLNIDLYDIFGKKVIAVIDNLIKGGNNKLKILTDNLVPGVYFVVMKIENKVIKTEKIIINNQ